MRKVGWIVDADLFAGYREELVTTIRSQGHDVRLVGAPMPPYKWDDVNCSYRESFAEGACVVAHGDIDLITRIKREGRWMPGAFATVENYFCSSYYCHLSSFLLNGDYIMLPFGELRRQRAFLFEKVGKDGRVFVRPDSPLKLFTGQVVTRETFERDMEFMGFYDFPANSLVLVSAPRTIAKEWRFIIADKRVIAGSQYKSGATMDINKDYSSAAYDLASTIASQEYQPDPVWVVDICETDDGYCYLLEIGGFSFADLYACDKPAVVEHVSNTALAVWDRSTASNDSD